MTLEVDKAIQLSRSFLLTFKTGKTCPGATSIFLMMTQMCNGESATGQVFVPLKDNSNVQQRHFILFII